MICDDILNYLLSMFINFQGTPLAIRNIAGGARAGDKMSVVPGGQSKEASSNNLSPPGEQQGRSETLERPENPEHTRARQLYQTIYIYIYILILILIL